MIYVKLMLMAVFWGGAFVAGRSVAQVMGPFSAAFLRFLISSIVLGGVVAFNRSKNDLKLDMRRIIGLMLLGLTGIAIYNALFFSGLQTVHAGRASAIIATNPIAVLLLSIIFYREKMDPYKLSGIILSVCGACIVIFRGQVHLLLHGAVGRGELYILGCVISWAVYSILGKRLLKNVSPLHAVFLATVFGMLFLLVPALREGMLHDLADIQPGTALRLLYLALFATVLGFVWFYDGVREIGPTKASQFINFVPVSAVILSFMFQHEPLSFSLVSGTFLVVLGVFATQYSK